MSLHENEFRKGINAIILSAGMGTRFDENQGAIPKPLIEVPSLDNIPIIEHTINNLIKSGIEDITVIGGHLGEKIEEFLTKTFPKIKFFNSGLNLRLIPGLDYEKGPFHSFLTFFFNSSPELRLKNSIFLVIPGDTVFEIDFFDEILIKLRDNVSNIDYNPIIFYRKVDGQQLKKKHSKILTKIPKDISIIEIDDSESPKILHGIHKKNLNEIKTDEIICQVIPVLSFGSQLLHYEFTEDILLHIHTFYKFINLKAQEGLKINVAEISQKYEFFDIDYQLDLEDMNSFLKGEKNS